MVQTDGTHWGTWAASAPVGWEEGVGHLGGDGLRPPPHQMERFHRAIRPIPCPCTPCRGGATSAPAGWGVVIEHSGEGGLRPLPLQMGRATRLTSLYLFGVGVAVLGVFLTPVEGECTSIGCSLCCFCHCWVFFGINHLLSSKPKHLSMT